MKKSLLLILFLVSTILCAQTAKREFRGAWIASVTNLDWPTSRNLSVAEQKSSLITMLDELKASGINAVVFQVRPECDALYNSSYEPWSYWLTGEQGTAPNPYYDPLEFAVEECHKRGIELHAWFNPYRAEKTIGSYPLSDKHPVKAHPEWVFTRGDMKMLDPGLPEVRQHILNVIMEVVNNYDVDGIHMDDYFYPYAGMGDEDAATYAKYPRGFSNVADWRRDNVNILLKEIYQNVQSSKPYVKFGMSPFGIWKNGVPTGITGMDAYSQIYCDPITWLHQGSIDYLTPQLYWKIGGPQDYNKLLNWWADSAAANNRHLYPGEILDVNKFTSAQLPQQIILNRKNSKVQGNVWFRALLLNNNTLTLEDSLRLNYNKYQAIVPTMAWKTSTAPNAPANLRLVQVPGKGVSAITWDNTLDTFPRYVVYSFSTSTPQQSDIDNSANIVTVSGENLYMPVASSFSGNRFYVTSLNRYALESGLSNELLISAPTAPALVYPANNALNQKDTIVLKWNYASGSFGYTLQVSSDPNFESSMIVNASNLTDTTYKVTGFYGQTKYYWRVKASNFAGASEFSAANNFTTGFPLAPALANPPDKTLDVPVNATFNWNKSEAAASYNFLIGTSNPIYASTTFADTVVADTTVKIMGLALNKVYYWKVAAKNDLGTSPWSVVSAFKTVTSIGIENDEPIPTEYALLQNYPNPFNPSTVISFNLKEAGMVSLKVYDILGKEVADLVNEYKNAGTYRVEFNSHLTGQNLASGLYIYTIRTNNFLFSRKMLLIK